MQEKQEKFYKCVLIGNPGVGKSSYLLRLSDDKFKEDYLATIFIDFKFKKLQIGDKKIKCQIWDTAGQEEFSTISSIYYKDANLIIIAFELINLVF